MNVDLVCSILDGIREGSCTGKHKYIYEYGAGLALQRLQSRVENASRNIVYYCVFCNHFHVGRSSLRAEKKVKKYMTLENLLVYDFQTGTDATH